MKYKTLNQWITYTILGVFLSNCGGAKRMDRRSDAAVDNGSGDVKPPETAKKTLPPPTQPSGPTPQPTPQTPQTEETMLRLAAVDVGIKNYLQINASFSELTGVPSTNAAIVTAFSGVKEQLPSSNSVKTFSASTQVGIVKLAAAYCNVLVNDATLRAQKIPSYNFNGTVPQALTAEGSNLLIDGLANTFWTGTTKSTEITSGKEALKGLLAELKVGLENGTAAQNRAIAVGICTAALSKSSIVMF